MALQSSGRITMLEIFQEKTGFSGSDPGADREALSLRGMTLDGVADYNDTDDGPIDVPGEPSNTDAPYRMSEFYGFSSASFDTWPTGLIGAPDSQWGQRSHNDPTFVQVGCNYAQFHDTSNDRIRHRWTTFDSSAPSVFTYADQDYTGLDSAQFQAKADYATTALNGDNNATFENPAIYSPASGVWTNTSTSGYSPIWQWTITISSGGSRGSSITSNFGSVFFYNRATLNGITYPSAADGYDGNQYYRSPGRTISLLAARSNFAQPVGPGGV